MLLHTPSPAPVTGPLGSPGRLGAPARAFAQAGLAATPVEALDVRIDGAALAGARPGDRFLADLPISAFLSRAFYA